MTDCQDFNEEQNTVNNLSSKAEGFSANGSFSPSSNNLSQTPFSEYDKCELCPRKCGINRNAGQIGYCLAPAKICVSRVSLHMWEEPCISGTNGSGTVFFSGCNLHCVFCQNYKISSYNDLGQNGADTRNSVDSGNSVNPDISFADSTHKTLPGKRIDADYLARLFVWLQHQNANNINLVTPTHYVPSIIEAIKKARVMGLEIPILYNSSGYESVETLKMLDGYIDIYLPDCKYANPETAALYSHAVDYPQTAMQAIREMVKQTGLPQIDESTGLMKKGVIVRVLVLPGHTKDAINVIENLYREFGNSIYISIMNQYTPFPEALPGGSEYDLLRRKLTSREYDKVVNAAINMGVTLAYTQEGSAASESFVPDFSDNLPI